MSAMAIRVRTRDSKTQDGEDDVLRSTDLDLKSEWREKISRDLKF